MPSAITITQIRNALLNLCTTQMASGQRLAAINAVGSTSYPETNVYPYMGIKRIDRDENVTGVRAFDSIIRWGITVVCASVKGQHQSDVLQQLDTTLDDGNDNGVEPILREIIQTGLPDVNGNRLLSTGYIKSVMYYDNEQLDHSGSLTQFIAIAAIEFITRTDFILQ